MANFFDSKAAVTVSIAPSFILVCMEMWRDAVAIKSPVRDEFKIPFTANRRGLLQGYEKSATAWGMLLGSMQAEGDHLARLADVHAKVEQFKAWTKASLAELDKMPAGQKLDAVLQDLQCLAADPTGMAILREMAQQEQEQAVLNPPRAGNPTEK
jgi:hypothetical protein